MCGSGSHRLISVVKGVVVVTSSRLVLEMSNLMATDEAALAQPYPPEWMRFSGNNKSAASCNNKTVRDRRAHRRYKFCDCPVETRCFSGLIGPLFRSGPPDLILRQPD